MNFLLSNIKILFIFWEILLKKGDKSAFRWEWTLFMRNEIKNCNSFMKTNKSLSSFSFFFSLHFSFLSLSCRIVYVCEGTQTGSTQIQLWRMKKWTKENWNNSTKYGIIHLPKIKCSKTAPNTCQNVNEKKEQKVPFTFCFQLFPLLFCPEKWFPVFCRTLNGDRECEVNTISVLFMWLMLSL